MNQATLQLKQAPAPIRPPVAWFISGADVAAWLQEICRWQVPQNELQLYVLPSSGGAGTGCPRKSIVEGATRGQAVPAPSSKERSAAGVLVLLPSGILPHCVPHALGFGVESGKLYLPVDAQLWPPVEPNELKLLHHLQVFHPSIGLVGFESSDTLHVSDLLRPSPSRLENWNCAKAGTGLNQRLRSIQLLTPVDIKKLFGDAPQEIGTQSPEDLPPTADEPRKNPLKEAWTDANRYIAESVKSLLNRLPHTSRERTWVNDLEDWASRKLQRLGRKLESVRNQQIQRLLRLLESNPEQGLQYAIPMNQPAHRGLAPPTNYLGRHGTDFNLKNLRGGRAADFWELQAALRLKLLTRYRELANRELQLGRFRRAAYIFAELLGDFESAASALKQGKHFREAAVVYKEYLHRPRLAAECLAEGSLIAEAIALYELQSCFLEAGDLYARIGQTEEAKASYEKEVSKCVTAGDRITGAKLLEEKLSAPERAMTLLNSGWPMSPQALKCLEAQFALLTRYTWHAETAALLNRLRAEKTRPELLVPLLQLLSKQSAQYPERAIRHTAADLVRVKASDRLDTSTMAEAVQLADALVKLAPEDKLLARDASRFSTMRNAQVRAARPSPRVRTMPSPVVLRTFMLPRGVHWQTVKSCGAVFFAAGYAVNKLVLVRGDWEGNLQKLSWSLDVPPAFLTDAPSSFFAEAPILMEADEDISTPEAVFIAPGPTRPLIRLDEQVLPVSNDFRNAMPAGTLDSLPDDTISLCIKGVLLWLLRASEGGLLECRRLDGRLQSNFHLRPMLPTDLIDELHLLLVQRELVWVAGKRMVIVFRSGKPVQYWDTETEIMSLGSSAPNLTLCALARLEKGVCLLWPDKLRHDVETIGGDLTRPLAAFTTGGTLVLLSGNEGRFYDVNSRAITSIANFWRSEGEPIAVTRTGAANEFAVFTKEARVQIYSTRTNTKD